MKKILIPIIVIAITAGAVKILHDKKAALQTIAPAKTYPLIVHTGISKITEIQLTLPYLALVQSDKDVTLTSKVNSRIKKILTVGSRVKQGDIVVALNDSDLLAKKEALLSQIKQTESEIRARQADLNNLISTHTRSKKLLESSSIAIQQYDNETAKILSARATIDSLRQKIQVIKNGIAEVDDTLTYTTIKSPINGIINKTMAAVGSIAGPGKPLLSISSDKGKYLLVRTTSALHPIALQYQNKTCQLQSLNSTFNGLDEYRCRQAIDQPTNSRVEIKLVIFQGQGVLLPPDALLHINDNTWLFAYANGQAKAQAVKVLMQGSEGVLVDGVAPNTEYIIAKPDILLKILSGYAVKKSLNKQEG